MTGTNKQTTMTPSSIPSTFRLFVSAICFLAYGILVHENPCIAQTTTVQLPSVSQFRVNTVVSVPDGGMIHLGGINRGASGIRSSSVPMLGVGPLFQNRAFGGSYSAGNATLHARIFLTSEVDAAVMAEAERRILARRSIDPNGSPDVQQKADFISRNIGRR